MLLKLSQSSMQVPATFLGMSTTEQGQYRKYIPLSYPCGSVAVAQRVETGPT